MCVHLSFLVYPAVCPAARKYLLAKTMKDTGWKNCYLKERDKRNGTICNGRSICNTTKVGCGEKPLTVLLWPFIATVAGQQKESLVKKMTPILFWYEFGLDKVSTFLQLSIRDKRKFAVFSNARLFKLIGYIK